MRDRAERRAQRERLKKRRAGYYGGAYKDNPARLVDTPTPCSCDMCGNPRRRKTRWHKGALRLTVQERRALEARDA